jgi:hypothetical protein
MNPSWYLSRLSSMSPSEVLRRSRDSIIKQAWRLRPPNGYHRRLIVDTAGAPFRTPLPEGVDEAVAATAREAVVAAADRILSGHWHVFGREIDGLGPDPDWFRNPWTGQRAPDATWSAFAIPYREPEKAGNVKLVWELSRHQHLTVLAAAYHLTRRAPYAVRIQQHLESWWRANPFLRGIHWTSGIEVGIRLMSWVWIRRLLHEWPDVVLLFEGNTQFCQQLWWHQHYLTTLPSHSSSANNHLIAEQAGLFVSACAFPIFDTSRVVRGKSGAALIQELSRQTFPCGLNRELATGYHGFVLELCLAAAIEGEASGYSLGSTFWETLRRMMDALAAVVDVRLNPPSQGDSDDGFGLLVDGAGFHRWKSLLSTGEALFGRLDWWPQPEGGDVRTAFWSAWRAQVRVRSCDRPARRPALFNDEGLLILRDRANTAEEIWCRCDHGPVGFLSTASHGHADALSIEVRHGGTSILADPGTYCYQADADWRTYFRSTRAHNTLEVAGTNQSIDAGPFLWRQHARCRLLTVSDHRDDGDSTAWSAEHDGYLRLRPPALHQRTVTFRRDARVITILDELVCEGRHPCRLHFHLGPTVTCRLRDGVASLEWSVGDHCYQAMIELPRELDWTVVRAQSDPPLGWFSAGFYRKEASTTLAGCGILGAGRGITTRLLFGEPCPSR